MASTQKYLGCGNQIFELNSANKRLIKNPKGSGRVCSDVQCTKSGGAAGVTECESPGLLLRQRVKALETHFRT